MNSPSVFLGDNGALPFSFMTTDSMSSFSPLRTIHDQSEIEVAQLMVSMSSQKPTGPPLFGRSSVPYTPPTRTFIYHTPTLSYDGDMVKRGRRTSPKKLVLSPSRCPCPNCGVESSTLWRNCDVCVPLTSFTHITPSYKMALTICAMPVDCVIRKGNIVLFVFRFITTLIRIIYNGNNVKCA